MVDMWFIRCPLCGNYAKKRAPQESAICRACGWEEHDGASFYCDIVNGFCTVIAREKVSNGFAAYSANKDR